MHWRLRYLLETSIHEYVGYGNISLVEWHQKMGVTTTLNLSRHQNPNSIVHVLIVALLRSAMD